MDRSANFITVIIIGLVVSFMPDDKPSVVPPRQPEKRAIQKQEASPPQAAPVPVETPDVTTVPEQPTVKESLPVEPVEPSPPGSVFGDIPTVKIMAVGPDNRYSRVEMEAWGVHIGNGRVATVSHIADPAEYGFRMQSLFVDGKPSRLYRHTDRKIDFGLASCEHLRDDSNYLPFRRAKYLERATIHAMKSQKLMRGVVSIASPEWILSLDEDETGVIQGDSGSPIVSESGELVGLVSGYKNLDDKNDHRIVTFVPIYELEIPGFAKVAAASEDTQILENGVVDFTASWCAPCRQMAPIVKALADEGESITSVDVDQHPELMTKYRVDNIPTFILFKDGVEVRRIVGSTTAAQLKGLLQ